MECETIQKHSVLLSFGIFMGFPFFLLQDDYKYKVALSTQHILEAGKTTLL